MRTEEEVVSGVVYTEVLYREFKSNAEEEEDNEVEEDEEEDV